MTFETFFNDYWIAMLIIFIVIVFIIILWSWISKKKKNNNPSIKAGKEINKIIVEIRKELRAEHKRMTTLFKDLDDFLEQLPPYFNSQESETREFKKLNDYSGE